MSSEETPAVKIEKSRVEKFLSILTKAIQKSHGTISTPEIIDQCYGEDAATFDDDENGNMLVGLLDDSLDKIDEEAMEHIQKIVKQYAQQPLQCLDDAIAHVDALEKKELQEEEDDRQSAQEAIVMSKLPQGVSAEDVLQYQAYLIQKKARDDLVESMKRIDEECEQLRVQLEEKKKQVQDSIESLDEKSKSMSNAADMCSYVVS